MKIIDRFIAANVGPVRTQTDGVILHSTGSAKQASQFAWFNNPRAKASSHTHHAYDGTVEQYVPLARVAWAAGVGSRRLLQIETQGDGAEPWTAAQIESLAQDIARMWRTYKFPLRLMTSSKKTEKGIGYHRLGVPRSRWVSINAAGWLVIGGERWSSAVGKVCPGDKRIAQLPAVLDRVKEIVGQSTATPTKPVKPKPAPKKTAKVAVYGRGSSGAKVKKLQRELNRVFPSYARSVNINRGKRLVVDGHYGPATEAWIKEFQRRAGLAVDGICGPLTQAALKKYGVTI